MRKWKAMLFYILICFLTVASILTGCNKKQSASANNKMKIQTSGSAADSSDSQSLDFNENAEDLSDENNSDVSQTVANAEDSGVSQEFLDALAKDAAMSEEDSVNSQESEETEDLSTPDANGRIGYNCDIEADRKNFDGKADIVVGDNLYTTQINDWYENFDQYEGKTVEIEGYYINQYKPYTFVGRYGPTCPYCNGGYVSFEFYTQDDLSDIKPVEDWIKVIGILRQGKDSTGLFYYIEVLSLEKMDQIGKDTVTN